MQTVSCGYSFFLCTRRIKPKNVKSCELKIVAGKSATELIKIIGVMLHINYSIDLMSPQRQVSFKVESNFRKYMCIKNNKRKLTKNKLGCSYVCFEFSFLWYRFSNMLQKQQREKRSRKTLSVESFVEDELWADSSESFDTRHEREHLFIKL